VRASQRPVHLPLLDEPSAHHLIDRGFDKRGADRLALPVGVRAVIPSAYVRHQTPGLPLLSTWCGMTAVRVQRKTKLSFV